MDQWPTYGMLRTHTVMPALGISRCDLEKSSLPVFRIILIALIMILEIRQLIFVDNHDRRTKPIYFVGNKVAASIVEGR